MVMPKPKRQDPVLRLRDAARLIEPNEQWVLNTRAAMLSEARRTLLARTRVTMKERVRNSAVKKFQLLRGPVMAAMGMVAVLFGGSIASVSASERALPGDFLYSLKLVTEQARLALTKPKDEKLKLKVEFASRRGDELKRVAAAADPPEKKEKRVEQAAEILKRDLDTVKKQLADVQLESETAKVIEAAKLVDETSGALFHTLEQTKETLPEDQKAKVKEAQAAVITANGKAIETLVDVHGADGAAVSEEYVVESLKEYTKTVKEMTGVDISLMGVTSTPATAGSSTGTTSGVMEKNTIPAEDGVGSATSTTSTTATVPLEAAYAKVKQATEQALAQNAIASASGTPAILPEAPEDVDTPDGDGDTDSETATTTTMDGSAGQAGG